MRRWLLALPVLLVVAVPGLYWAVGAWLETAGGRAAVERALGERLGMPVHLLGDFEVMLWPDIGVSGTELVIGEPGVATEVARGDEFELAVALRPLIRRELRIDSVGLHGGAVYPDRFQRSTSDEASAPPGGFRVPDISSFTVRDLVVGLGTEGSSPVRVERLEFRGFASGAETPFDLAVEGLGALEGQFRWSPAPGRLDLSGSWIGVLPDPVAIEFDADLDPLSGRLSARSLASDGPALSFDWRQESGGWSFTNLRLSAGGQSLVGQGCYGAGPQPSLQLDLAAETLDLTALTDAMPALAGGQGGDAGLPFDLKARVRAGQVSASSGSARQVELTWGGLPDCGALEEAPGESSPGDTAALPGMTADEPEPVPEQG